MKKPLPLLAFILICLSLLHTISGRAQYDNHLILRRGYKNIQNYLRGDSIRFSSVSFKTPIIGKIDAVGEDFIVVRGKTYPIKNINTLYRNKSIDFKSAGKTLQVAGPAFMVISAVNAFLKSIRPIWSTSNLITSGGILTAGIILPRFQVKKYKLGKRYNLRIAPTDPVTYKKNSAKYLFLL
ncbi:MAG: hypothetical protein J7L96_01390 [Bacteroidales bacterium]|nr:hypothetical protein [Bacteroidales bacterium]